MQSISPVLTVRDMDASVTFYREVLGFVDADVLRAPDGKPVHGEARRGSVTIQFSPAEPSGPDANDRRGAGVILYIQVGAEDIDRYWESVVNAGADVIEEIKTQFWGDRCFSIADPDGYHLMFAKQVREVSMEELQAHAGA